MKIGVDRDEDQLTFKRAFILLIQMSFLLPITINKISPIHMPPIFCVDTIRNWGGHIFDFLIKGISEHVLKRKKSVDSYLYGHCQEGKAERKIDENKKKEGKKEKTQKNKDISSESDSGTSS
ncbi:hypothetical protein Ahy_B09g098947 [Arachis hypogaea]|uniref:Aminotransferase-like plant mobile domain-containing protein n=1 Tax=Arachis hypogaea TaxID=3818 RepID=A0A444XSI1_ARAHY|nr:hypothetical protein Ahy_B09g098947 [Arachis hypogaea]